LPPATPGSNVAVTVAPEGGGTVVGVEVTAPPGVAVRTVGSGVLVRAVAVEVLVAVGVKDGPVDVEVGGLVTVGGEVAVPVGVPPAAWFTTAPVEVSRIESPVSAEKTSVSRNPPWWNAIVVEPDPMTWKVIVTSVNGAEGAGAGGGAWPAWKSAVPAGL